MKKIILLPLIVLPSLGISQTVTKYLGFEENPGLIHYSLVDTRTNIVIEEGRYVQNSRDGVWVKRWPNGNPQSQAKFEHGTKVGVWKFWNEDGDLIIKKKFNRDGQLVFAVQYRHY